MSAATFTGHPARPDACDGCGRGGPRTFEHLGAWHTLCAECEPEYGPTTCAHENVDGLGGALWCGDCGEELDTEASCDLCGDDGEMVDTGSEVLVLCAVCEGETR